MMVETLLRTSAIMFGIVAWFPSLTGFFSTYPQFPQIYNSHSFYEIIIMLLTGYSSNIGNVLGKLTDSEAYHFDYYLSRFSCHFLTRYKLYFSVYFPSTFLVANNTNNLITTLIYL
jgi:hypothetical protein